MPYNAPPPAAPAPYNLNAPSPWQQGYPNPDVQTSATPGMPGQPFAAEQGRLQPMDYSEIMHKKSNVLLGNLLFEAGLISQSCLQAALKMQELVRDEKMSTAHACEILKRHHGMGEAIDQYLNPADFDMGKLAEPAVSNAAKQPDSEKQEKIKRELATFDFLQKSGLLKEEDLKTAHMVHTKHGGDLVTILQAAGKLDAITYSAAETCMHLIKDGSMKVEQCIIALNYCSRSRVDFDTALDELGWENPRKATK
jgi:hypothetical protein